jgi:hypothetical protein
MSLRFLNCHSIDRHALVGILLHLAPVRALISPAHAPRPSSADLYLANRWPIVGQSLDNRWPIIGQSSNSRRLLALNAWRLHPSTSLFSRPKYKVPLCFLLQIFICFLGFLGNFIRIERNTHLKRMTLFHKSSFT